MTPTIMVTGATGNVGAEVARALLKKGIACRAADLDPDRIRAVLGTEVEAVRFSFTDPQTYAQVFVGIERLFLLRPPQLANVRRDMFPALQAAAAAGVKHFVFLSLIEIEQNPQAPHFKVEQKLQEMDAAHTFLRPSFFMQNLNTTHRDEIRLRDELFIPAGESKTSFIDARDIGAVAALVLAEDGHAGQAYDLTGSQALDYDTVARLFSEALDRKITYRNPSSLGYVLYRLRHGMPLPFALITAWLYASTRRGMAARVTGETARLLGRQPIPLRQYIEDYRTYWMRD